MGYQTHYKLAITPSDQAGEVIRALRETNEEAAYALEPDGSTSESSKWYEHEEDIREFSKKYPDLIFKLEGEGEEAGDIWIKYFQNGKCQVCKAHIKFDVFDPEKLV